jgi:hypothetical protein
VKNPPYIYSLKYTHILKKTFLVRRKAILDGTGSFEQKRRNFNKLSICFENKAQSHSEPRGL